jgi:hypothetical protein
VKLVAVDTLIKEASDLWAQGESYMVRAGQKYIAALEVAGTRSAFDAGLSRGRKAGLKGLSKTQVNHAIACAKSPAYEIQHKARDAGRKRIERATGTSRSDNALEIRELASEGELHEATLGFRAMIKKAVKSRKEDDWRTSHERRTVAFQHFKKLLTASNLPQLMNMTPDEIIELIRTI